MKSFSPKHEGGTGKLFKVSFESIVTVMEDPVEFHLRGCDLYAGICNFYRETRYLAPEIPHGLARLWEEGDIIKDVQFFCLTKRGIGLGVLEG